MGKAATLDGLWSTAEKALRIKRITGTTLTQSNGKTVELRIINDCKFEVVLCGKLAVGELRHDGNIHWDDGDIWIRRDAGPFDGSWSTAEKPTRVKRISGTQLTQSNGTIKFTLETCIPGSTFSCFANFQVRRVKNGTSRGPGHGFCWPRRDKAATKHDDNSKFN